MTFFLGVAFHFCPEGFAGDKEIIRQKSANKQDATAICYSDIA